VLEPGVEDDPLPHVEPVDALPERLDHAGAVCTEDPRLRHGRQPLADPDVEVVERRGTEADEHLSRAGNRIRDVLDPDDVRAAVLVDPGGEHGTILA
jgi:hypothetical protein